MNPGRSESITIRRALISCWDKTGIADLAVGLINQGVEIISSGGTAEYLHKNGVSVTPVEEITGFRDFLNGRVKTLHPSIHGAILARRNSEHLAELVERQIEPIDLVIVNLYPFTQATHQDKQMLDMTELIDIGGPAMLRSAAKNYEFVAVLHQPTQYAELIEVMRSHKGCIPVEKSIQWATDAFFYSAYYDSQIAQYFQAQWNKSLFPKNLTLIFEKQQDLRYGENPHQAAALYSSYPVREKRKGDLDQLWGKPMSYNNYIDVISAAGVVVEFDQPAVAIVKHTNPCGAATDKIIAQAFSRAYAGDPVSAFGGIIACNHGIDRDTAQLIQEGFFECLIAPDYQSDAMEILKKKKNLRILKADLKLLTESQLDYRPNPLGLLVQESDRIDVDWPQVRSVGARAPLPAEQQDLLFAWRIVKHVKSNAIIYAKDSQVIGVGAGQMSRVDSVKLAGLKARQQGHTCTGAVMASDAFFPFPDGIEEAARNGITAIIQPGGSVRDPEVIETAKALDLAMLMTDIRHFKH